MVAGFLFRWTVREIGPIRHSGAEIGTPFSSPIAISLSDGEVIMRDANVPEKSERGDLAKLSEPLISFGQTSGHGRASKAKKILHTEQRGSL